MVAGGIYGSFFGNGVLKLLSVQSKTEITQMRSSTVVTTPNGAIDGELWKLTSNGTFSNKVVTANDHVLFIDSLSDVIIIYDTSNEITNIQSSLDVLSTQIVTISQQAILRGIIDYIWNETIQTNAITGQVLLPLTESNGN